MKPPTCRACADPEAALVFTMAFQPIVDVLEHRINAYEALVRWPSGDRAPVVLQQVTEANRYAFDQACRVKAIGMASDLGIHCRLNINFLPNAIYEPKACIALTLETARQKGFSARSPDLRIYLERTHP